MKIVTSIILLLSLNINAQDRWEKLNGPQGGNIAGLIAKGDTLITATGVLSNKGIIFYSTNGGKNWQRSSNKFSRSFISFVFISDNEIIGASYNEGLYKSNDLINWIRIFRTNETFYSVGKGLEGILYAGTDNGKIYFSTNNELNWNISLTNYSAWRFGKFLSTDNYIFAGAYSKLFRKNNNFANGIWEELFIDSIQGFIRPFSDSNKVYFFSNPKIYKSTDEGNTWNFVTNTNFFTGNSMYDCIYNNRMIGTFGDETGWFGDGWGIAVSDDEGLTWKWSNEGLPPKFLSAGRLAKSNNNTYVGTNAVGVFKSTDFGESWFPINNGINAADTKDICFGENEEIIYSANWSNGFQKSTDKGETWEVINNGLTNSYCWSIIADDNGNLIGGTSQGTFRSTDKGENWIQTANVGNNFSYKLYKDRRNRIYSLNSSGGLYRTTDLGLSWQRLDNGFASTTVWGIVIDEKENIYAGTRGKWIYKSTDDGNSWYVVKEGSSSIEYYSKLAVAPNGDIYAASSDEGILKSTDEGNSWQTVNGNINLGWTNALGINSKG